MKKYKFSPLFLIIPLFIIGWGIFNVYHFNNFYGRDVDPEYPYLFNGLNIALLEFDRIGHFDHPGTPFQVYCGIIIRVTHLFTGEGAIAQDVLSRPDYYLNAINISLFILQAILCFFIAWVGRKREIKIWPIIILQSGVLLNALMTWLFCRVIPERMIVMVALLFIIVYLLYGYKNKHPLKFAIWSGVVMGMGMATKFNFLPVILLPFFLINSNKNRGIYAVTGIASFFFFLLPIIKRFHDYKRFMISIATHDGIYGQGAERMFNPAKMKEGIFKIFEIAPELALIIFTIVAAIFLAILFRKKTGTKQIVLFIGILFIIVFQMVMVSKHFSRHYLLPLVLMYPLFLFLLDDFIRRVSSHKKWAFLPVALVIVICIGFTTKQTIISTKSIKEHAKQSEIMQQFIADHIPPKSLWFLDPIWLGMPFVENGMVYGLCYSRYPYKSELMNINPNIITCHAEDAVRWWYVLPIPVDSIVVTKTPIYLYASPSKDTGAFLIEVLNKAALRNNVTLSIDTLFSNHRTNSHFIVMQNHDSQKEWRTDEFISIE